MYRLGVSLCAEGESGVVHCGFLLRTGRSSRVRWRLSMGEEGKLRRSSAYRGDCVSPWELCWGEVKIKRLRWMSPSLRMSNRATRSPAIGELCRGGDANIWQQLPPLRTSMGIGRTTSLASDSYGLFITLRAQSTQSYRVFCIKIQNENAM